MITIHADDMSHLWLETYQTLVREGEHVPSRIGDTRHLDMAVLHLTNPRACIAYNRERPISPEYMMAELVWYFSGTNRVEYIGQFAKTWLNISDDGRTVNSAYGYRIFHQFGFDQLQFVIDKLLADPQSRQAVIHIKDASNKPTKDTPCTCLIQFVRKNGRLDAITYMRSNDIWFGTPYDVVFFTTLQRIISAKTGIPLGEYYHVVGDLHVYEKNVHESIDESTLFNGPEFDISESDYMKSINNMSLYLSGGEIGDHFPVNAISDMLELHRERKKRHEAER